jgi:hypothetical protein
MPAAAAAAVSWSTHVIRRATPGAGVLPGQKPASPGTGFLPGQLLPEPVLDLTRARHFDQMIGQP